MAIKWSRVQLALSILTAAGLWQTLRERIGFARSAPSAWLSDDPARPATLPTHYDLAGVLHVHSTYSDGIGTVSQIADAAAAAGVDFVWLTDHSTLEASAAADDGWRAGARVLVLVGAEVTTNLGHLLVGGVPPDFNVRPGDASAIMRRTLDSGGYGFIALPCDLKDHWRDFGQREPQFGLEVFNLSAVARTKINLPSFLLALGRYRGKQPLSAFSYVAGRPKIELALWDRLSADAHARGLPIPTAIGSLDAHAVMRIGGRNYPYPTYEEVFRTLRTHVLVSEEPSRRQESQERDRALIDDALRHGHSFVAYDNYGDSRGFMFELRSEKESVALMGDSYRLDPRWPVTLDVHSPDRRSIITLLRNGLPVMAVRGPRLRYRVRKPGVYRVEVSNYRWRIGGICIGAHPWIFSNPIEVSSGVVEGPVAMS